MKVSRAVIFCCFTFMVLSVARRACAAEISLWPMAEFDEIYDDNVNLTPTNRKGDFVSAETFGATLEAETAARNFFLTYQTELLEYASYPGLDSFGKDHAANLRDDELLSAGTTLSISDSLLVGNAISNGTLVNGATPVGSQMMESLFYQTSILSNDFAIDLSSRYSDSFTWTADIHQLMFTTLSGSSPSGSPSSASSGSGYFFDEGGAVGGEWDFPERFAAGFGYQFDDFRTSGEGDLPTTESHWPQLRMGWGKGTPFSILAQVGPIITDSSSGSFLATSPSGATSTTAVPAAVKVDAGYLISGNYKTRRLTITASAGQEPGFGAGFVGYATEQVYGLLISYKLSRRATVFLNGGYYTFGSSGASADAWIYSGGMTYRLNEYLFLSANYLGFSSKSSGPAVAETLVAVPGARSTINLFQVGVTLAPPALKWRF